MIPPPATVNDIREAWVASALVGAGEVEPGTAIELRTRRIGVDRGMTSVIARVDWKVTDGAVRGTLVAKLPRASHAFERSLREIRFLETLAPRAGVRVPRPLRLDVDQGAERVALLLEHVEGDDGDVVTGCAFERARAVVDRIRRLPAASTPVVVDCR